MAQEEKIKVELHQIDTRHVQVMAQAVQRALVQGIPGTIAEAEIALITTYVNISSGARDFDQATRTLRGKLFVLRAAEQLAKLVKEIGALPDAAVFASGLDLGSTMEGRRVG